MSTPDARGELGKLASLYGVDGAAIAALIESLGPQLDEYAEIVLCEDGFEVITAGRGRRVFESFARTARVWGACERVGAAFGVLHRALQDRTMALKVELGDDSEGPSCYVRTKIALAEGIALLESFEEVAPHGLALAARLQTNSTLYGVGLTGRESLRVKTYTLSVGETPTGFTSHRIDERGLHLSPKQYDRKVVWSAIDRPSPKWERILDFAARELGYGEAGHVGTWRRTDAPSTFKVYVERIGAIATELDCV